MAYKTSFNQVAALHIPASIEKNRRQPLPQWQRILKHNITTAGQFSQQFPVDSQALQEVIERYPLRINQYYGSLIKKPGDAIWKQVVPDERELLDTDGMEDPLAEDTYSPVPNITHRYPGRVLFLVSNQCAVHCRFCTRKRKIGKQFAVTNKTVSEGIAYIRFHREVRDVLISGGDPLLLEDYAIADILLQCAPFPTFFTPTRALPHQEGGYSQADSPNQFTLSPGGRGETYDHFFFGGAFGLANSTTA